MNRWAAVALLLPAWFAISPAAAHTRSESHSTWLIDGAAVHLTFSVADIETRRLTADARPAGDAALIMYLDSKVGATAEGRPCPTSSTHSLTASPGFRRIEFLYHCPSAQGIVLHSSAFFEAVPTHVNLAQVKTTGGELVEQVLTADVRSIDLGGANGRLEEAGFLTFVRMGIMHIFTGVDHMSFLLGLVLISRRFRDLALVITGFTLGHSLTLALSVTGIIRPHAEFIDALVALTIALIGVENIAVQSRRPGLLALWTGAVLFFMAGLKLLGIGVLPVALIIGSGLFASNYLMISGHIRDAAKLRLVVTLVFGLIHGFGFAADLLSAQIPSAQLAQLLVGFNLGVEIGQLTVVTVLSGSVLVLRRLHFTLPRPIVVDVCASFLVLIGTFWFVGRSYNFTG